MNTLFKAIFYLALIGIPCRLAYAWGYVNGRTAGMAYYYQPGK
jgi:hypothetical protein